MRIFIVSTVDHFSFKAKKSVCYLVRDNWNDYNYYTTFSLSYFDHELKRHNFGQVKIMNLEQKKGDLVKFPSSPFTKLDKNYCSLGQEQNYYEEMMSLLPGIRKDILLSLRDCVYDKKIFDEFKDEDAMKTSLLRTVTKRKVENTFRKILGRKFEISSFNFSYRLEKSKCKLEIDVKKGSLPATNLHVLIGRNGVGKTSVLVGLAHALTKSEKAEGLAGEIIYGNSDDRFTNLIAIAFSAFDPFMPIPKEKVRGDIRYEYIGLKKHSDSNDLEENFLKMPDDLDFEFKNSVSNCINSQRKKRWIQAINTLNSDPVLEDYKLDVLADKKNADVELLNVFTKMSSGHKIILLSITKLIELVEEKTLVLLDEPETHLHPPLLSSFIKALSELLLDRNGLALIATHSPVVLQEVPKSCVTLINRSHSEFSFDRPKYETFGESVGTLTREVFKLEISKSGFRKIISDQLDESGYEGLIKKFENQIGAEGRAIARSLIISDAKKNA